MNKIKNVTVSHSAFGNSYSGRVYTVLFDQNTKVEAKKIVRKLTVQNGG